jgi:hypothetical protein
VKFHITNDIPIEGGTTGGYWAWSKPRNRGELHVYCVPLPKRRYLAAVIGHELVEAAYCKIRGIETATCDIWDTAFEKRYESGEYPYSFDAGSHPGCPYYWGHKLGIAAEYLIIYSTFAGWSGYERACNEAMGIDPEK